MLVVQILETSCYSVAITVESSHLFLDDKAL